MATNIPIRDIPGPIADPSGATLLPMDNGTMRKTTVEKIVLAGRPTATQSEAEAGVNNTKAMTPLTVAQAVAAQGATLFTPAGASSGIYQARDDALGAASASSSSAASAAGFAGAAEGYKNTAATSAGQSMAAANASQAARDEAAASAATIGGFDLTGQQDGDVIVRSGGKFKPARTGFIKDEMLAAPSKIANRRDDIIDLRDWNAQGAVTGGDGGANAFTYAMQQSFADLVGKGAEINIPLPPNGQPYRLGGITLGDKAAPPQSKIKYKGGGPGLMIQPAGSCLDLLTVAACGFEMEGLWFQQFNNFVSRAALHPIADYAVVVPPNEFKRLFFLDFSQAILHDAFFDTLYERIQTLNCDWSLHFQSGGTGSIVDRLVTQGGTKGIFVEHDDAFPARRHMEGLVIKNSEIGPAGVGGIGIHLRSALLIQMSNTVVGQIGDGGNGMYLDGTGNGSVAMLRAVNCWFESGKNGRGVVARGNNVSEIEFRGCDVSTAANKTGGIAWDFENVSGFLIDGGRMQEPTGLLYDTSARFVNSTGVVRNVRGWDKAITEDGTSEIFWDTEYAPPASSRSLKSSYPRAAWTPYTFAPGTGSGSGTVFTGSTAHYRRVGKTVEVRFVIKVVSVGSGGGSIRVPLPVASKNEAGRLWAGNGKERTNTGKDVTIELVANANIGDLLYGDNTSAITAGATIVAGIVYESA